jgi:hypothetical protein
LGRPAKKRCRAEAKATRLGQLQAEYQFKKAHSIANKPYDFLEEQGKKLLDKIDPVETAAIIGTTIIVHGLISENKAWVAKAIEYSKLWSQDQALAFIEDWYAQLTGKEQKQKNLIEFPDWSVWLVSLSIAYIVIKHGGQLIGLLEKGLTNVIPLLLGVAV